MQPDRVFVVGSSLFAETLAQILGDSRTVTVIGSAPTPEATAAEPQAVWQLN
jgi:hypothetical protein